MNWNMAMPQSRGGDYEVGYGKPPSQTQFKAGQSGNPKGRPAGTKSLATILKEALNQKVPVTENGRRRTISKLEAISTQLVNKAATADLTAVKLLLGMIQLVEAEDKAAIPTEMELSQADEKVMKQLLTHIKDMQKGEQP